MAKKKKRRLPSKKRIRELLEEATRLQEELWDAVNAIEHAFKTDFNGLDELVKECASAGGVIDADIQEVFALESGRKSADGE